MAPHGVRIARGEAAILLSSAVYGVSTTVSVLALRAVRPADLLAVELIGAAAVLLGIAALRGRLRWRGAARNLVLGGLFPGATFLLADLGLARTSASSGSLLVAVDPLLSVLLAVLVLRERMAGRAVVALVVGLGGSALVAFGPTDGGTGASAAIGNLLVLGAVVAGALFLVATRRYSGHDDGDGFAAGAWQTAGGALLTAPFVAFSWAGGGSRLPAAGAVAWIACLGVVLLGAVGGVAYNRGIAHVPASRAGQLMNLTPVIGTLTGVVFLHERPALVQLAGGAAILAGLALLLRAGPAEGAEPPVAAGRGDRDRDGYRALTPGPEVPADRCGNR
ncbi:DMT family transporter [Dactylosporangium vinaceum]|uniref:DMT family transporter n=1 Tax=Dactylosporangium vinaceum TaxID=53362 RepID=A0ABV5MK17_9ACTN|nr:DMT family transporter [Dactylosporangium vinaceum]UAB92751.1 DMT family transporter [Dactylosporangium vinaceum]